jgi:hypothetical protein
MTPRAEVVHWLFATGFLLLGLLLLAEAIVGRDVWRARPWRAYLWPSLAFGLGVLLWPVSVFFTNSTLHMVAHASWAETAMIAGAAQLALVRGKLHSRWWTLAVSLAMAVSGSAFLIHEQNPWLFSRSAFLHHALGWTLLAAALFPIGQALRPRAFAWNFGFAMSWITVAVLLYCDRDVASIFGHLSPLAGAPK